MAVRHRAAPPAAAPAAAATTPAGARFFGAVAHYPVFRRFWLGALAASVGQWMQQVALGWLAIIMTNSPGFVGIVTFSAGLPFLVVAPFGGSLIDRFGPLPQETKNLLTIVETKINCRKARIAKLDVGARGAVVTFVESGFPDLRGLLAYVDRLQGAAKLRPDSKLVVSRDWASGEARLNGALQISRGLAKVAMAGEKVPEPA